MKNVRIGIIGFGTMGRAHYQYLSANEVSNAVVTAVFDVNENVAKELAVNVRFFSNIDQFIDSHLFDAVLIATP
ncbi:MAG: Gfo/Idh/MocA family oxidoreductase, partial [Clostridia bacterium]|nr:Gfo/Idh/MocA family oxidoreductase [Clostridia bacterium]